MSSAAAVPVLPRNPDLWDQTVDDSTHKFNYEDSTVRLLVGSVKFRVGCREALRLLFDSGRLTRALGFSPNPKHSVGCIRYPAKSQRVAQDVAVEPGAFPDAFPGASHNLLLSLSRSPVHPKPSRSIKFTLKVFKAVYILLSKPSNTAMTPQNCL